MTDTHELFRKMVLGGGRNAINVDIVIVIDATISMKTIMNMVKETAISFPEKLYGYMKSVNKSIKNLRIKVICFRDFYYDGIDAYDETEFFILPEEKEKYRDYVNGIHETGGGDDPESGLEALTLAMRSDFVQEGDKKRHIIVLFTDSAAHPLEDYDSLVAEATKRGYKPLVYPANMPKSLEELFKLWEGNDVNQNAVEMDEPIKLDSAGKRLVLFAPNAYPWSDMEAELTNTIRIDIEEGQYGGELDMDCVLSCITHAI